jgi:putative sterol carrier protein
VAVRFLTEQWAEELQQTLNSSDDFKAAAAAKEVRVQQVVTGAPEGEVKYYVSLEDGRARIGIGELADADATIAQRYETAAAISRGDLGAQQAFVQGQLKITGNLMKLMQLQGVLSAMSTAVKALEVEY